MANNVVRRDLVTIDFKIDGLKELKKLQKEMDDLKKKLTGGIGDDALDDLKDSANESVKPLKKVKEQAEKVTRAVTDIGKKAAVIAYNGLKKIAGISFKALSVGIGAAATAVTGLVAKSVSAYADYEQLIGGVETLFKDSAGIVQKNANDAFKTAGLSANDYMETVTSFSASLIASCGGDTAKAADLAHVAIVDMSDNANKMGSDMESIQNAYQGFAKQNYTMLDNLKLGYGGTKEEMARLVKDAAKIDKSVKSNDMSNANIVKAIHAVQKNLDIMGTTQKEASSTISGSLASMKSAWGNMLTAVITGGDSFDQCLENLVDSAKTFGKNVMPAILGGLEGIGTLIEDLTPIISEQLPILAEKLIPPLINATMRLTQGLIKALPTIIKTVAITIVDLFGQQFPIIKKIGGFFEENAGKIAKSIKIIIPLIVGLVAAFKLFKGVQFVTSLFGGKGGKGGKGGGIFGGLIKNLQLLAKMKTSVVLKGMANLGIIFGGFTLLAVAFMALAPYMSKLTDVKSLTKLITTVGVLGLVGAGLAKLGGIVGKIPVAVVSKGLANMAIMLGGMAVLFMVMGAVSLLKFDYTRILYLTGIIGALGTVGAALSIFAGIVGMIPIPVVLSGLANMALVLGGITTLILAFGKLSEIQGFNEFISKGGDTLANLFNQIGKIAGSLVGGIGEGIANSLPKIGLQLSAFAVSLRPLFTMVQGVDMAGVGSFFSAIGSFMLKMAGNDLASIFTGGTDLGKLGTELSTFANNSQSFFTTVATFPENGFKNATTLFQSLADIGNVPKTGGIAQWFGGETNFTKLSVGLNSLASEGVKHFYNTVSELPEQGFNNAKLLFQSLADIGNIPNTGGIAQWFSGENDFAGLASKLPLFGKGMAEFYASISGIDDVSKISQLFKAMKDIGKAFPNKGGLAQLFTGENDISGVGEDLKKFGEDTKEFFNQVNGLNISNLNALWDSLKKPGDVSTSALKIVSDNINKMVKEATDLPKKMASGIQSTTSVLVNAISAMWKSAVKASKSGANQIASSANSILSQLGSNTRLSALSYAKGTNGHVGGNAIVNDGRGAELVQMPNGNTFIPKGRNVFIPNAPRGMKVLSAEQTAHLMGRKSPTFRYAEGTGNIDIWNYLDNAKGLVNAVLGKYVKYDVSGFPYNIKKGVVKTAKPPYETWTKKQLDEFGAMSISMYNASKGVEQWKATVIRALKMEGMYSEANVARTLMQMRTESGGNPRAINLWDSNAKRGIPSKGLMQVIDPTFKSYARAGFDKDVYDPLSNVLASVRYAKSRYGSLERAFQGHGYENGGLVTKPGWIGEKYKPEMVIPLSNNKRNRALNLWEQTGNMLGVSTHTPESNAYSRGSTVENNTINPVFNLTINGDTDPRTMERKVRRWIKEALNDTFDTLNRKNPRLQEV